MYVLFAFQNGYDEYLPDDNSVTGEMENMEHRFDNIKSECDDEMDLNQPNDVIREKLDRETEKNDSNAINELLIDGMRCDPVSFLK